MALATQPRDDPEDGEPIRLQRLWRTALTLQIAAALDLLPSWHDVSRDERARLRAYLLGDGARAAADLAGLEPHGFHRAMRAFAGAGWKSGQPVLFLRNDVEASHAVGRNAQDRARKRAAGTALSEESWRV